jgi:hypothetical protein
MAKQVSEQLSDLSDRAQKAEVEVAAMKDQTSEKIEERQKAIQADADKRKAEMGMQASDMQDRVVSTWSGINTKVQHDVDDMRKKIDVKKAQHDRSRAENTADEAEQNAAFAIDFALVAIDNAESAVLDAVYAREYAESM